MDKLFFQMPCLSESAELNNKEIYEKLFDKKVDKRYLDSMVQKFIMLNKRMLDFLGIEVLLKGAERNLSLHFKTSNKIGAIPIRMPYDGIAHKDFQVFPRFDREKEALAELTRLLSVLEYSITPEYFEGELLTIPLQLRPPLYYEAVKYVELFEKVYKYSWVKFKVVDVEHNYPKSNTSWEKYTFRASDPRKALQFPSRDNIFSKNHKQWQELKYVFDLAKDIIINATVPASIRFKYQDRIMSIQRKVASINSCETNSLLVHASDPIYIKGIKAQANVLLQKDSTGCMAWRMDMAELFERYIQHIVAKSIEGLSGTMIPNGKIFGKGNIPHWGLKYLEPDIMIKFSNSIYMADAKYKAHFYARGINSEVLNEVHRADLHQLLAYCAFEPQENKTGILFYPAETSSFQIINYADRIGGIINKVILCGIPFGVLEIVDSTRMIKELFQNTARKDIKNELLN